MITNLFFVFLRSLFFFPPELQVSAEHEGGPYVFQGYIQGRDYGQFGLQRQGACYKVDGLLRFCFDLVFFCPCHDFAVLKKN